MLKPSSHQLHVRMYMSWLHAGSSIKTSRLLDSAYKIKSTCMCCCWIRLSELHVSWLLDPARLAPQNDHHSQSRLLKRILILANFSDLEIIVNNNGTSSLGNTNKTSCLTFPLSSLCHKMVKNKHNSFSTQEAHKGLF